VNQSASTRVMRVTPYLLMLALIMDGLMAIGFRLSAVGQTVLPIADSG
jgi:hypothetical protein